MPEWKLVPTKITNEMMDALQSYACCAGYIEEGYEAMLKAAPSPHVVVTWQVKDFADGWTDFGTDQNAAYAEAATTGALLRTTVSIINEQIR